MEDLARQWTGLRAIGCKRVVPFRQRVDGPGRHEQQVPANGTRRMSLCPHKEHVLV